jgi:hypothetical protein
MTTAELTQAALADLAPLAELHAALWRLEEAGECRLPEVGDLSRVTAEERAAAIRLGDEYTIITHAHTRAA